MLFMIIHYNGCVWYVPGKAVLAILSESLLPGFHLYAIEIHWICTIKSEPRDDTLPQFTSVVRLDMYMHESHGDPICQSGYKQHNPVLPVWLLLGILISPDVMLRLQA